MIVIMPQEGLFALWSSVTPSPVAKVMPEEDFLRWVVGHYGQDERIMEAMIAARETGCSEPGTSAGEFLLREAGMTPEDLMRRYGP